MSFLGWVKEIVDGVESTATGLKLTSRFLWQNVTDTGEHGAAERAELLSGAFAVAGPHRIEAGWWPDDDAPAAPAAARDYYIAQNPAAELLWIYRERATSTQQGASNQSRWFLQGLYA